MRGGQPFNWLFSDDAIWFVIMARVNQLLRMCFV